MDLQWMKKPKTPWPKQSKTQHLLHWLTEIYNIIAHYDNILSLQDNIASLGIVVRMFRLSRAT